MSEVEEGALVREGAIPPDDFTDAIERIAEVADYDVELPADLGARVEKETQELLLSPEVAAEAAAALSVGNLVLQGPPGTGKSSLARALCRAFGATFLPVTAHEDWSVFDVIGRQELRVDADGKEEIVPVNGFFADAAIGCAGAVVRHFDDPSQPQAMWLLIDELNRAHIDRAFGELFTVLGTDEPVSIVLPHQREGNRVLVTPRRFRVVATLNSYDRQFVNALSEGLRRRFTFINVDIPPPRPPDTAWHDTTSGSIAAREFTVVGDRAIQRVERKLKTLEPPGALDKQLAAEVRERLTALFDLAEQVRYAGRDDAIPHLPIGTAQLIDTAELVIARAHSEAASGERLSELLDWAASVKLAPLFDTGSVNYAQLIQYADGLPAPFDRRFRRELKQLVAAGGYYVE
jgi:5-methylcytosine-specific restriction protein B